jgi:hypothetical protein
MTRAQLRPAILLCSIALAPAACGESDGEPAHDEGEVRDVIEQGFTSTSESVCTELATEEFVESLYGEGDQGLQACRQDVTSERAKRVEVSSLQLTGHRAAADVKVVGGDADGQELEVDLVYEDRWRLNELEGFNVSDSVARTVEALVRQQLQGSGLPPGALDCILDGIRDDLRRVDIEDFEAGQPPPPALQTRIEEATRACLEASHANPEAAPQM